jgi:hypothetical protein
MATKFLDLDSLRKPMGTFKFGEVEYDVYPMSVENLINLAAMPENMDETDTAAMSTHIHQALDMLAEVVPQCPKEQFRKLTLPQIYAIIEWVNTLGEESVTKNSAPPKTTKRRSTSRP